MNIRYFEEYLALYKSLSFTNAAAVLHVSQSTLSKHIDELEKEFGAAFFYRNRHHMEPTKAGRVFYEDAYLIVTTYQNAYSKIALSNKQANTLSIGGVVDDYYVHAVMAHFKQSVILEYPDLNIRTVASEKRLLTQVIDEDIDLAFIVSDLESLASQEEKAILKAIPLKRTATMLAAVYDTHKLANRKTTTLKELSHETLIRPAGSIWDAPWSGLERSFRAKGLTPNVKLYFSESHHSCSYLNFEPNIFIVNGNYLVKNMFYQQERIKFLPIADAEAAFYYHAVYKDVAASNLLERFIQIYSKPS
jgi:DNA-binding transcriptional LysR family regulator